VIGDDYSYRGPPMRRSKLTGIVVIGLLSVAISLEVRIALSAYLMRIPSVDMALRAARLTPANEEIYLRLADLDPGHRGLYLRKAAEVNPSDARPWLDQAFMAEADNNGTQAELDLNQAAKLDVRSRTAWALADFYFRQNNMQGFYSWGRRYRRYADGNATGLFRLDWSRNPTAAALLKDFSPLTCKELEAMASFVESHATPSDVAQVEQQLASCANQQAVNAVMNGVSRLLMADHPSAALQTWNGLRRNAAFQYADLDPTRGRILTNADFANQLQGSGFDWRINQTPGIRVRRVAEEHSLEFSLDGSEPEVSTLLFQPVILIAGSTYRLQCRVQSEEGNEDGFHWRLVELSTGRTLESGLEGASSQQNGVLSWTFLAPASPRTLVLAFTYARPKGDIKSEGTVRLSDITLRAE
jgi:hypothetical protein